MKQPLETLVVEDSPQDAELLVAELRRQGFEPNWQRVETEAGLAAALRSRDDVEVILCDFSLPQFDAFAALDVLERQDVEVPLIIVSGAIGEETAVEAMRRGAADYLLKDSLGRLGNAIRSVLERRQLIDARRQAAAELADSERRFRLLVSSIVDYAIVTLDPDGLVASWNEGARRQTGYQEHETVGRHVSMFHTAEDRREEVLQEMLRVASEDGQVERHLMRVRKDGSTFPTDIAISAIRDDSGALEGFASVARDVTERKQAEEQRIELVEQLQRSQRLESLGRLAGGIAHDFNNTLGAISNYAYLASATVADVASRDRETAGDLNEAVEDIGQIQQAVRKAAELTARLLILGRKDTGSPTVLNPNTVVAEVSRLLDRTVGDDLILDVDLAADLWNTRVDPTRIEQVLLNLSINARDAMPEGGRLTIRTFNVDADRYVSGPSDLEPVPHVCVEVGDTGHGMDPETADQAFDPFFTTKPTGRGTGLGLAVVHGIVSEAGGRVHLYTEPGLGTTIKLFLPAVDAPVEATVEPGPSRAPRGHGELVLVVEDQASVRDPLVRMLERSGYEVWSASHPAEALELVEERDVRIDLLLTDVLMPHMSGHQLAERLTDRQPGLRVVFMSGFHGTADQDDSNDQMLAKPFGEHELLSRVRQALED